MTIDRAPGEIIADSELAQYQGVWIARWRSFVEVNGQRDDEDRWPVFIQSAGNGRLKVSYARLDDDQLSLDEAEVTVSGVNGRLYCSVPLEFVDRRRTGQGVFFWFLERDGETLRVKFPNTTVFRKAAEKKQIPGRIDATTGGVQSITGEPLERFLTQGDPKKLFSEAEYIELERIDRDFQLPEPLGQ